MPQLPLFRARLLMPFVGSLLLLAGCNDSGGDTGPSDPVTIEKAPSKNGDGQMGQVSSELDAPIRVLITRNGTPVPDISVTWTASDGGAVTPSVTESGDDGIAEATWVLGPEEGPQSASASVEDATGSPVAFTAEASPAPPPAARTVAVTNNQFTPRNVTVLVGQSVSWVWGEGAVSHNVVPSDGVTPASSGAPVSAPQEYSFTFTVPGVYTYYCQVHGQASGLGMAGTVTVLETAP